MSQPETLELEFHIDRTPEEIRAWWLDFAEDYRASDPKEQPFRIRTLSRTPERIEVETWWGGPFGSSSKVNETLRVRPDGSWSADLQMMGLAIHDEFRAQPDGKGSRLTVRSTITPVTAGARLARPLLLPLLKKSMRRTWTDAAAICEREAPPLERAQL